MACRKGTLAGIALAGAFMVGAPGGVLLPDTASAQSLDDRARAVGERDRQDSLSGSSSRRELPPSLGEIRLLRPTDLFYAVIDPSIEYTDNAFYSRGGDGDLIFNPSAAVGVQTTVADFLEVELEMGLEFFYYEENSVLDSVNPYWNLEFYTEAGPIGLEFDLQYSLSYETAFSGRDFSSVSTTFTAYWPIDITDDLTIEPFVLAQRAFRTPSPSQFYQGEVGVEVGYDLTSRLYMEVEGFVAYGENDNQFNTTFGETPNFLTMATSAEVSYSVLPWLQLELNLNYFRNESNIPGSSYDRLSFGPGIYSEFSF